MSELDSLAARDTPRAGTVAPWVLPAVQGPVVSGRGRVAIASEIDDEHRTTREHGYRDGYAQGLLAAGDACDAQCAALAEEAATLQALLRSLAVPLERFDAAAAAELARLALNVGGQLARRDLRLDPSQVIAILRECVQLLPAATREIRVQLHPLDAAVVRARLSVPSADCAWVLVEDPTQSRGGCRVQSGSSHIDARLESRVATAVAAVLGDEHQDSDGDAQ